MTRQLTLGTAGHVDHGKTRLVRALTGVDTDRLEEEQRRGISIVLGYAVLPLGDVTFSVVDVPGHERFVRTMVGGATGIDVALVCIAADDGVMPQTLEHIAILELLGVRAAVVALTKTDVVDEDRLSAAEAEIRDALATTAFASAPIVPVSAETDRGLDALREALRAAAATTADRSSSGRARLPIDRAFVLHGIGTVVTGTLWAGTVRPGDTVTVEPGHRNARVRSLEVHGTPVDEARAGSRLAAALVGIERDEVAPGAVLWTGQPAATGYRLDLEVRVLPSAEPLRRGTLVEVLHGTTVNHARVITLGADEIAPDQTGFVQLRLDAPISALREDRVVLRRLAPPGTIAGGRVLDPHPRRHAGTDADLARLRLYAQDDPVAIARAALTTGALRPDDLVTRGLLDPDTARTALAAQDDVVVLGDWHLSATRYGAIRDAIVDRLTSRQRAHPLDPGLPLESLLRETAWREHLVARLAEDGTIERDGAVVRLAGAGSDETAVADDAVAALAAAPFATHRQADLADQLPLPSDDAWAVIALLERTQRIARLPDGLVVHRDAYDEAVRLVRERCAASGEITLAGLRDATASSRKVTQALLERMDADGITRRTGDTRILRRAGSA